MESYFDESKRNEGTPATSCVLFCSGSSDFGGQDMLLHALHVASIRTRIEALILMALLFIIKNPLAGDKNFKIFY
jgi:hypothetical protein